MSTMMLEEQSVDLTKLDVALRDLWQRAREMCESPDEPLSRALTLNYIAVCAAADVAQHTELLERVLLRHPCRAFLVTLDERASEITGSVTADVRQQGKGRVMVMERIAIRSSLQNIAKLPGLIRPLIVNDIPVHFFWGAPLPQNELRLLILGELANQTIVDSSTFADPMRDMKRVQELPELEVRDLAWFRLAPWRRALAEAFETFEWQATQPTTVTIEHGGAPASCAALARWLEEKLSAHVVLRASASAAPAAEPLRIELQNGTAHVAIEHLVTQPLLRVQTTLLDVCMLPFVRPASRGNQGDLLAAALDAG